MRLPFLPLAIAAGFAATAANAGNLPSTAQPDRNAEKRQAWRQGWQSADCHRDVRTHRIDGVKLTHRHVGETCQVRVVRKVN